LGSRRGSDGRRAVSASRDKTLVWDLETGTALYTLQRHSDGIVAVAADGRQMVSSSAGHLTVWDLDNGIRLRTLQGHSDRISGMAVTGDGRRAVSASYDRSLKVWDLETGALVAAFTCDAVALCCAFANARRIVAGNEAGGVLFLSLELGDGGNSGENGTGASGSSSE
jgi:WD40 repeat protein